MRRSSRTHRRISTMRMSRKTKTATIPPIQKTVFWSTAAAGLGGGFGRRRRGGALRAALARTGAFRLRGLALRARRALARRLARIGHVKTGTLEQNRGGI